MPPTRSLIAAAGALLTAGVLIATVWVSVLDDASRDVTSFAERRLPLVVLFAILAIAAAVPFGVLGSSHDVTVAAGLTLAGTTALTPLWAAWPDLDPRWRALALATGPLAVAGLALMARSWVGAGLATASGLLHALAYNPFGDLGCARVCAEIPAVLEISTDRLTLLVSLGLSVAAGFVLRSALRRRGIAIAAAAGALGLAAMAVVRWHTTGDGDAYADLLLAGVPIPGLVALPAVAVRARVARRRFAVRRLTRHLAEDPEGLLELGNNVDASLLSAGQQLALRNADLAKEARTHLAEVQASQRRIVAAVDAERRRIERDLHDGTQQRLVGVLMQLSGLELKEVEHQVREVLADLRSFSQSAFPRVLEAEGLEVALAELTATSDAELRLDIQLARPVPPEYARALYALVALAASGTVDVSVVSRDDGFDVTLVGLARADVGDVQDRFGALGGTLAVTAERIEGSLPCAW